MSDLAEFLLARIAEDEAVARVAAPGPWEYQDVESVGGGRICDPTVEIADLHYEQPGEVDPRIRRTVLSEEADGTGWHIARWDPARVLAKCKADRRIVENHRHELTSQGCDCEMHADYVQFMDCDVCCEANQYSDGGGWCLTLRALALPYADHPDFREEWKP